MNNLFSGKHSSSDVEMATPSSGGANLDKFFEDAETIKDDLKDIDELLKSLKHNHEESKTVHNSKSVKDLRSKMDRDVSLSLKKAKLIKVRLEALDRGNAANRSIAGCEAGSSADRTRTSVVGGLRNKLKGKMDEFQELRERINAEYRETIERRYFTVTGEHADEQTVDQLISTGESENFLQKAIQDQGRGKILDTITEIQERHDAVRDMERNLRELHEVFMDMAVLVEQQGEHMNDIEAQVHRANSFVKRGTEELQTAKKLQKNSRKWVCIGIIVLLIIILILLVSLHPWTKKWSL